MDDRSSGLSDLGKRNFWLIVVTLLTTVIYVGFCLWKLFRSPDGSANYLDSVFPANPRAVMVLCCAVSTLTLLFLPDLGRVVTAFSSLTVLFLFCYWWSLTSAIKASLGVERLQGANWLSNTLIDAYPADLFMGIAAMVIFFLDIRVLWKTIPLRLKGKSPTLVTPVANK